MSLSCLWWAITIDLKIMIHNLIISMTRVNSYICGSNPFSYWTSKYINLIRLSPLKIILYLSLVLVELWLFIHKISLDTPFIMTSDQTNIPSLRAITYTTFTQNIIFHFKNFNTIKYNYSISNFIYKNNYIQWVKRSKTTKKYMFLAWARIYSFNDLSKKWSSLSENWAETWLFSTLFFA